MHGAMPLITEPDELAAFCDRLAGEEFVTVDTEFVRESTYWPHLCLIQLAGESEARVIDAIALEDRLGPVFALFDNPDILKVVHAGRQDVEIFLHLHDRVPTPLYDTQIAAMVCGLGDQVGYDTLVAKLTGASVDKQARFADWAHRPLNEQQIEYARADVTHLRDAYRALRRQIAEAGREGWIAEEMQALADPEVYRTDPETAWRRIKVRTRNRRFLAVLKETAATREHQAMQRDLPRNRVVRDESLLDIAGQLPRDAKALARIRGVNAKIADGPIGEALLGAVERALALPKSDYPDLPRRQGRETPPPATLEMLKLLLKLRAAEHGVAQRLIASSDDLAELALDDAAEVEALRGWRRQIFGEDALALKHGRIALSLDGTDIRVSRIDPEKASDAA
jgi:ribonuclease D